MNSILQFRYVRLNVPGHQVECLTRRQHDQVVQIVKARCADNHLASKHQSILQALERTTLVLEQLNQSLTATVGDLLFDGFLDTVVLSSLLTDLFSEALLNLSRSLRLARLGLQALLIGEGLQPVCTVLIVQQRDSEPVSP